MPWYEMVAVDKLLEPRNPQRQETLYLRLDEMREDLRKHGQRHNIGVQKEGDSFRIIWGHRRSICATQLQWSHIYAKVFDEHEEVDHDEEMGGENYHRQDTNPVEEARYYERILGKYPDGTIGIARELNVPQTRVETLLTILRGNPTIVDALAEGSISVAQANEINKFNTPGYQLHALEMAKVEGKSADSLRRWRQEMHRNLQDQPGDAGMPQNLVVVDKNPSEPMDLCNVHNGMVRLMDRKYYSICKECDNIRLEGMEYFARIYVIKEAGLYVDFLRLCKEAERIMEAVNYGGTVAGTEGGDSGTGTHQG